VAGGEVVTIDTVDFTTGEIDKMERIPERVWAEAIRTHVEADHKIKEPRHLRDGAKRLLAMAHETEGCKRLFDEESGYESLLIESVAAPTIDVDKVASVDIAWLHKRGLLRVDVAALERQPDSVERHRVLALTLPGKPRKPSVKVQRRDSE
jgi:hypothetical protein